MHNDITGIVLAGGKSSRMGKNKALLKINNETVIEQTASLLKSLFSRVIIITNTPDDYRFLNLEMFPDIYLQRGPLSGIHSGLYHSITERNFILSCDIPFISAEMISYLINFNTTHPVTVVRADGFIQQLAGVYSKSVIPAADKLLNSTPAAANKCKVLSLLEVSGAEILNAEDIPFYKKNMFFNMNTLQDYEEVLKYNTAFSTDNQ